MKQIIALLVSLVAYSVVHADFKTDLDALANREEKIFDTSGHRKSQGINLKIRYPASWLAEEGDRSLIVQKFRSDGGKGIGHFTVTISNPIPDEAGELTPEIVWDKDFILTLLPPNAKLIDFQKTTLDGEPTGMMVYAMTMNRAGTDMTMRVVTFTLIRKGCLLSLNGNLLKMPSQSADVFESQAAKAKLLYQAIAASLILTDKGQ